MTAKEHQTEILEKLTKLTSYVNRLSDILKDVDINNVGEDYSKIENHIFMIQGQKEFVKNSINDMKSTYGQ